MIELEIIEARTQQCKNTEDYAKLATEVAATDTERARALLKEAELLSQFPSDYIRTATGYIALSDPAYATDLIEQAEEACFEALEYAAVGKAWGELLGNTDKACALLQQAAGDVQSMSDRLVLAQSATMFGAEELAQSLYDQVEKSCKTIEDYADLTATLLHSGDESAARKFFSSANTLCHDIASTVAYATTAGNLLHDPDLQRSILDDAQTDCQFPKEFVQLATGYHQLLGDTGKVDELLEQGAEFAFSGAEYLDLANGYLQLQEDKSAAAAAYQQALSEINDRVQLREMAITAAHDLEDQELAKAIYAKLEQRSQSTADRLTLAQSVLDDIDDKDYAIALYQRIEEGLTTPRDLTDLAASLVKNLGDRNWALSLLQKALNHCANFQTLSSLFDSAASIVNDEIINQAILDKWTTTAESTTELLTIYQALAKVLDVPKQGRTILLAAEERITSLGEMKNVAKTVARDFPDETVWQQRLADKLQRRQANQSTYTTFQKRETQATQGLQLIRLARDVMQQLSDEYYSRKLLNAAAANLLEQPLDLYVYHRLLEAITEDLEDPDWAEILLQQLAKRCKSLLEINQLTGMVLQVLGARKLAGQLLQEFIERELPATPQSFQVLLQLAAVVWHNLHDQTWLRQILQAAQDQAATHYDWVAIANMAAQANMQEYATTAYDQAAALCRNTKHFQQLSAILHDSGHSGEIIAGYYALGEQVVSTPLERIRWAEGIIDVIGDREWATKVYQQLANELNKGPEVRRFQNSRKHKLQQHLQRPRQ